jgi:LemA protein
LRGGGCCRNVDAARRRAPSLLRGRGEDMTVIAIGRRGSRGSRGLPAAMALALMAFVVAGCGVNTIPTLEEQAKAAWSEVLNQYQRRADLIPNLVESVKGAAQFERETLQAVVEARSRVAQTQLPADVVTNPDAFRQFEQNQTALSSALSRLLVVVERYPDLKANQNFLALQSQLEGTENRITVARRDYIEAVRRYNTELRTFPGRLWAMTLYAGAEPMQTFTISDEAREAPKVKF